MQADVCHQPGLLGEAPAAVGTRVGFLAGVEPLVGLEVRGATKSLPTDGAFKGSVPAVDHLVRHQVGGLVERLATNSTFELPFLAVRGQVNSEVGQGDERLVTFRATVRIRAEAPMWSVGPKTGWALGGSVRFVPSFHGRRFGVG